MSQAVRDHNRDLNRMSEEIMDAEAYLSDIHVTVMLGRLWWGLDPAARRYRIMYVDRPLIEQSLKNRQRAYLRLYDLVSAVMAHEKEIAHV